MNRPPALRIVVGAGVLGQAIRDTSPEIPTFLIPARQLEHHLAALGEASAVGDVSLILAHGANVNVRNFAAIFDDLLLSRIAPLSFLRTHLKVAGLRSVTLVSSLAAYLPAKNISLAKLQRSYEEAFRSIFDDLPAQILRVGTFVSPTSQLVLGVHALRRTLLMRRLRLRRDMALAWAAASDVAEGLRLVENALPGATLDVLSEKHLGLNQLLDLELGDGWTIKLSDDLFGRAWSLFGVRSEFLTMHRLLAGARSTRSVLPYED